MSWKRYLTYKTIALAIIIIGILVFFWMMMHKPQPKKYEAAFKQTIHAVTLPAAAKHQPAIHLFGKVEHPRLVNYSAAITAPVKHVYVKAGEPIAPHQKLLALDTTEAQLLLDQHKASLNALIAKIKITEKKIAVAKKTFVYDKSLLDKQLKTMERYQSLLNDRYISQADFDDIESALAKQAKQYLLEKHNNEELTYQLSQLLQEKKKLSARVKRAELDISYSTIRAEFDGVVSSVSVADGDRVQVGMPLLRAFPHDGFEVHALIPLDKIASLRLALQNKQHFDAHIKVDGVTVTLRLNRLIRAVKSGHVGQIGVFTVKHGAEVLSLGRYLAFNFSLPPVMQSFILPESSIHYNHQVYRVDYDKLHAIKVAVKGRQINTDDQDNVIVVSSQLRAGDKIMINQLPNAINGLLVNVEQM